MNSIEKPLQAEADTIMLAQDIAIAMQPGDALLLSGALGAGKSVLARAAIRKIAGDASLEVPSPTYTICQAYQLSVPVSHFDLYRIGSPRELDELGLAETLDTDAVIVEWPERGIEEGQTAAYGTNAVLLSIDPGQDDRRIVRIEPFGSGPNTFWQRISRSLAIRDFLSAEWATAARREFLQGDASARRYETVAHDGEVRVLMDAPRQPDGPPVRDGLPYSQIAHLAEDVTPFVAIAHCLRKQGFAAPKLHACDLNQGLLLLEHLGEEKIAPEGQPDRNRYLAAAQLLAELHAKSWPGTVVFDAGKDGEKQHRIPAYDRDAMMIEVSLFADWYVPDHAGKPLSESERAGFDEVWDNLISAAQQAGQSIVLRDYHSPNLIWREELAFPASLGLIDFQDAVRGPLVYDVASLAQDARVDISAELESEIVAHYLKNSPAVEDVSAFHRDYAIMAAQRATKILGIFVRLKQRDGKDAYLKHLPRMRDYLNRSLQHEVLSKYREWLGTVGCLPTE